MRYPFRGILERREESRWDRIVFVKAIGSLCFIPIFERLFGTGSLLFAALMLKKIPVSRKNVQELIRCGRRRWKIENEGFNTQKRQGYHLEHQFSKNYQGMKNHYYLIQIGHMPAQVMEAWEKLWKRDRQSREQKHKRLLESFKETLLKEYKEEIEERIQIRFG